MLKIGFGRNLQGGVVSAPRGGAKSQIFAGRGRFGGCEWLI